MLKKTLMGFAVIAMCCSLASAGEGDFKISGGLDVGVVEELVVSIQGVDFVDTSTSSVIPHLAASMHFTEEFSVSLGFSAVIGLVDDSAEFFLSSEDVDASVVELKFGGLCEYTFTINEEFSVTPVAGISWTALDLDIDEQGGSGHADYTATLVVLDFGARAAFKLNDEFSFTGQLMLGLPVAGSAELGLGFNFDADFDGGFIYEIGGGLEYKLGENLSLYTGLAYKVENVDWDWETDENGETELTRLSLRLGVAFTF
jgi:Outer membrane protein beta-barrel domain